jgi:3-oxoadipate enol-lactonase
VPALVHLYRVIRYDVRGHGLTDVVDESSAIWDYADDLVHLVDYLGFEKAAIVGISMGGMIAQAFVARNPERTAALGLISTVSVFGEAGHQGLRERARVALEQGMEPLIAPAIERWFTKEFRERAHAASAPRQADNVTTPAGSQPSNQVFEATMISAIEGMIAGTDPRGYAAACRALAQADLTPYLERITCPTLIMSGESDPNVTGETQAVLRAGIPENSYIRVPNSSHLIPIEQADESNNHILSFLAWSNYR